MGGATSESGNQYPESGTSSPEVTERIGGKNSVGDAGFEPVHPFRTILAGAEREQGGPQAPARPETVTPLPGLSLEDRLAVALSRRGSRTIDEFLFRAWEFNDAGSRFGGGWTDDADFVEACERYADLLGRTP